MNRERAKELLPIIQAYAEGKKIQVESHNHKWFDVTELDDDFESLNYRIKPEYNGIFKLKSLLEENHIPFEWVGHNNFRKGCEIYYPEKDEKCVCSVLEHSFNFGNENNLQIKGLLTEKEEKYGSVLGNLTADNVFQRILSHWNGTREKTVRPFQNCDELIAYWHKKIEAETKYKTIKNDLQVPLIWVKHKVDGRRRMIVGFGENFVEVGVKAKPITLERLFEMYTFLDGSPCGVSE